MVSPQLRIQPSVGLFEVGLQCKSPNSLSKKYSSLAATIVRYFGFFWVQKECRVIFTIILIVTTIRLHIQVREIRAILIFLVRELRPGYTTHDWPFFPPSSSQLLLKQSYLLVLVLEAELSPCPWPALTQSPAVRRTSSHNTQLHILD